MMIQILLNPEEDVIRWIRYRFKFSIKLADYQVAESSPEGSIR